MCSSCRAHEVTEIYYPNFSCFLISAISCYFLSFNSFLEKMCFRPFDQKFKVTKNFDYQFSKASLPLHYCILFNLNSAKTQKLICYLICYFVFVVFRPLTKCSYFGRNFHYLFQPFVQCYRRFLAGIVWLNSGLWWELPAILPQKLFNFMNFIHFWVKCNLNFGVQKFFLGFH